MDDKKDKLENLLEQHSKIINSVENREKLLKSILISIDKSNKILTTCQETILSLSEKIDNKDAKIEQLELKSEQIDKEIKHIDISTKTYDKLVKLLTNPEFQKAVLNLDDIQYLIQILSEINPKLEKLNNFIPILELNISNITDLQVELSKSVREANIPELKSKMELLEKSNTAMIFSIPFSILTIQTTLLYLYGVNWLTIAKLDVFSAITFVILWGLLWLLLM